MCTICISFFLRITPKIKYKMWGKKKRQKIIKKMSSINELLMRSICLFCKRKKKSNHFHPVFFLFHFDFSAQFAIIDKVPVGSNRVSFQFVAAIEPQEDFDSKKLRFSSLKVCETFLSFFEGVFCLFLFFGGFWGGTASFWFSQGIKKLNDSTPKRCDSVPSTGGSDSRIPKSCESSWTFWNGFISPWKVWKRLDFTQVGKRFYSSNKFGNTTTLEEVWNSCDSSLTFNV